MKKKTFIIACAIFLVTLLIPIPQALFTFILGALLTASLAFLLITSLRKKVFYPAPKIFTILLIIMVGLELHFTKNLIFGWDYIVYGYRLARVPYVASFIILGLIFVLNLLFTISFVYKETLKFDPLTDMNKTLFRIDHDVTLNEDQKTQFRENTRKVTDYYSKLQKSYKTIVSMLIFIGFFTLVQIIACFLKRYIILEPTIGNVVGFNLFIYATIIILEIATFVASKKYPKTNS